MLFGAHSMLIVSLVACKRTTDFICLNLKLRALKNKIDIVRRKTFFGEVDPGTVQEISNLNGIFWPFSIEIESG